MYLKISPNGKEEGKTRRINPEMPIPPEATAIHGITDEDVKDCPTFKEIAKSLASQIEGCDLAGFNSNRFDIPSFANSPNTTPPKAAGLPAPPSPPATKPHQKTLSSGS